MLWSLFCIILCLTPYFWSRCFLIPHFLIGCNIFNSFLYHTSFHFTLITIQFSVLLPSPYHTISLFHSLHYFLPPHQPFCLTHTFWALHLFACEYDPQRHLTVSSGELAPVKGTAFDLRNPTTFGEALPRAPGGGFDHNFCLQFKHRGQLELAASFLHPPSGEDSMYSLLWWMKPVCPGYIERVSMGWLKALEIQICRQIGPCVHIFPDTVLQVVGWRCTLRSQECRSTLVTSCPRLTKSLKWWVVMGRAIPIRDPSAVSLRTTLMLSIR